MEKSTVAIVRGERGHEPVFKALDLIDYGSPEGLQQGSH